MGHVSRFSEANKREAIAKAQHSGNISQTARELGIRGKSLQTWIKQYGQPASFASSEATPAELATRVRHLERQLSIVLFDYIEVFYNRRRLHSSLGFECPVHYAA